MKRNDSDNRTCQEYSIFEKLGIQPSGIHTMDTRTNTTFHDLLHCWLEMTHLNVKESTYVRYTQLVSKHIANDLGELQVTDITTQMIEQYARLKLRDGRIDGTGGLSSKSVADIIMIIKSALQYADSVGLCVNCKLNNLTIRKRNKDIRVLSEEEQIRLEKILFNETDRIKFGVLLSLYTGIRIGELCALRWEHLNLNEGILQVRMTMQRLQNLDSTQNVKTYILIDEPKSRCSIRDIPLPAFLIHLGHNFQSYDEKAYILTGTSEHYIEPRTVQYQFQRYIKQAQIKPTNYHALRHTFATRCVEKGFETKSLSEILGHANVNITLNRYVHSSFQLKKDNMQKLDRKII